MEEDRAPYLRFEGRAREHLERLLEVERGWRRALVRGVLEEHGLEFETEGATATARPRSGAEFVLRFDIDRGIVEVNGKRLKLLETDPYERADRKSWGTALELLAAVYAPPGVGWAKREGGGDLTPLVWAVDGPDESDNDDAYPTQAAP